MSWTLEYDGTRKSFAYWGIAGANLSFRSLDVDTFVCQVASVDGLAAPGFDYGEVVTVRSGETGSDATSWTGGTTRFVGEVVRRTNAAEGSGEGYTYECAGPWHYLSQLVFEQTFKVFSGWIGGDPDNGPDLVDQSTSHVVLNQTTAGALQGTQDTLGEILDWAIDDGCGIQYTLANLPDMNIPKREQREILCSEAIARQLDYMDAVTWFDYSTSPPTFHCKRRSGLTPVSLALDGTDGVSALGITPRDAQQVPFVVIRFEKTYQDTYGTFLQVATDSYPDPLPASKRGGLTATVVLVPTVTSTFVQELEVAAIDETDIEFWKVVKPELANTDEYNGVAVVGGSTSRTGSEANYIINGAVTDWMSGTVEDDEVTCKISYTQKDTADSTSVDNHVVREQVVKVKLRTTDLESGTYKHSVVTEAGEDPSDFTGIAQTIYTDLNALSYSGTVRVVEDEPTFAVGVGNTLNLTGGQAAWTTMAALVQGVSIDIAAGTTEIELGPNPHMDAGKIVELLRVNRTRVLTFYSAGRASATLGGGDLDLPAELPRENTTEAARKYSQLGVSGEDDSGQYRIELKAEDSGSGDKPTLVLAQRTSGGLSTEKILLELSRANGVEIKIREARVCRTDGETGYVLVLCSEFYTTQKIGGETPIGEV